jgi:hypothetical protein
MIKAQNLASIRRQEFVINEKHCAFTGYENDAKLLFERKINMVWKKTY